MHIQQDEANGSQLKTNQLLIAWLRQVDPVCAVKFSLLSTASVQSHHT